LTFFFCWHISPACPASGTEDWELSVWSIGDGIAEHLAPRSTWSMHCTHTHTHTHTHTLEIKILTLSSLLSLLLSLFFTRPGPGPGPGPGPPTTTHSSAGPLLPTTPSTPQNTHSHRQAGGTQRTLCSNHRRGCSQSRRSSWEGLQLLIRPWSEVDQADEKTLAAARSASLHSEHPEDPEHPSLAP
jgi:hypothetical protein